MLTDAFERLPPEILLNILHQLTDLEALVDLLAASPSIWRLFNGYSHGAAITDKALESSSMDIDTKTLIRTIAHTRQGALPVASISEVRRRVTNDSLTHRECRGGNEMISQVIGGFEVDDWFMNIDKIFSPTSLAGCAPAIIPGLLATFRHIRFLALSCLKQRLEEFRGLQPRRAIDTTWQDSGITITQLREGHIPSCPMTVQDFGAPTWSEEQGMLRAFWRIEFVNSLKSAVLKGMEGWSDEDRAQLSSLSSVELFAFDDLKFDIQYASYGHYSGMLHLKIAEHSLLLTAEEYLAATRPTIQSPRWSRPWSAAPYDEADKLQTEDHWNAGIKCFSYLFYNPPMWWRLSEAYRRLGLFIWCKGRLDNHGFSAPRQRARDRDGQKLLTWVSVLSDTDLEAVVAKERRGEIF